MTNIGVVNYGSCIIPESPEVIAGDFILQFGDFIILNGKPDGDTNFLVKDLNLKNSPKTDNTIINGKFIEGGIFQEEKYGDKEIKIEIYMIPTNGKTINDLILDLKDAFYQIKDTLKYYHRGEVMELESVLNGPITFGLKKNFKTATINLIGNPFFSSQVEQSGSTPFSGSSGNISFNNDGHRIEPKIEVDITGGNSSGATIGDLIIQEDINNGDNIEIDFENKNTKINSVTAKTFGDYNILKRNAELLLEFTQKEIPPTYTTLILPPDVGGYSPGGSYGIFTVGQSLTKPAGLNYIKKIVIQGTRNYDYASINFNLRIYTSPAKTTLLHSQDSILRVGESIEDPEFIIDGGGVNISAYSNFYVEIEHSAITGTSTWHFNFTQALVDYTGGDGYVNGSIHTDDFSFDIYGLTSAYSPVYENITSFDTDFTYKNKYI